MVSPVIALLLACLTIVLLIVSVIRLNSIYAILAECVAMFVIIAFMFDRIG